MNWKNMTPFFIKMLKRGKTDKEMVSIMKLQFGGSWTPHMIRSQRGRLERAGMLPRGVAGSSTLKEEKMTARRVNKIKAQRWTEQARQRAWELYWGFKWKGAKKIFVKVSDTLVKDGLRNKRNPGAVSDQISRMRVDGREKPTPEQLTFVFPNNNQTPAPLAEIPQTLPPPARSTPIRRRAQVVQEPHLSEAVAGPVTRASGTTYMVKFTASPTHGSTPAGEVAVDQQTYFRVADLITKFLARAVETGPVRPSVALVADAPTA